MTSLRVIVAFFFAHIIGCALSVWSIIEFQTGNTYQESISIKISVVYDLVVFVAFGITLIILTVLNVKKTHQILVEDDSNSLESTNN